MQTFCVYKFRTVYQTKFQLNCFIFRKTFYVSRLDISYHPKFSFNLVTKTFAYSDSTLWYNWLLIWRCCFFLPWRLNKYDAIILTTASDSCLLVESSRCATYNYKNYINPCYCMSLLPTIFYYSAIAIIHANKT